MKQLIATAFIFVLTASVVSARTWQINPAGTGDASTIQAGLDSSSAGDTVLVAAGTYYERDILVKSGAVLMSEQGREFTTIDAQRLARVLLCDGVDSTTVVQGFTITRGFVLHNYEYGGGILCVNGASPLLTNNEISRCLGEHGGGVAVMDSSSPRIEFSYIHHDSARGTCGHGGGIILAPGGSPYVGHVRITNNTISDNFAQVRGGGIHSNYFDVLISGNEITGNVTEEENGGGIALGSGTGAITDNLIVENVASWQGGGILLYLSSLLVSRNTLRSNVAGNRGGGIHCDGSSPVIDSCLIDSNSSLGDYGGGGAICCQALSCPVISNCIIVRNTSEWSAAGIHCDYEGDDPHITGNTIAYNISPDEYGSYGGIACWHGASPTMERNVIVGNFRAGIYITDYDCAITLNCNCVWGNLPVNYSAAVRNYVDTTGDISSDPLFCDPDNDDYHLHEESPCAPGQQPGCGLIGALDVGCYSGVSDWIGPHVGGTLRLSVGPNPTQAGVRILYEIPAEPGLFLPVTFRVYDAEGRIVRTFVAGSKPAGRHIADWDGLDAHGLASPPGIYFCQLQAGEWLLSRKIVLVR